MQLNKADIARLTAGASGEARAGIARKISVDYAAGLFNASEKKLADEIFRLLLKDAEVRVRAVLAEHLHMTLDLPHDIALALAKDPADEAALPILEHSCVLTEEDLIEIVESTRALARLKAIARRQSVSRQLSCVLLHSGEEEVVQTLLANRGASIEEKDLTDMLATFQRHPSLLEALVMRGGLSFMLAEKLFTLVSDEMKKLLSSRYHLSRSVADNTFEHAREWATLEMLPVDAPLFQVEELVNHLYEEKKLTYSIVIRALCMGDLRFFETAIARLAGVPVINARMLMLDPGPLGFRSLYQVAAMPDGFYEALHALHRVATEETSYGAFRRADYKRRIIKRLIEGGYDRSVENMPYLLSIIGAGADAAVS